MITIRITGVFAFYRVPFQFLPRDAMRKRGLCCRPVSVCPSVTSVHCIQTAEDIGKLLYRPGSTVILRSCVTPAPVSKSKENPFNGGTKYKGVGKFCDFSIEIAVYYGNVTRYAHGCYETLIGSHMRSIEW